MAYSQAYDTFATTLGVSTNIAIVLLAIISIWTLVWKGLALWKAGKKNSKIWFVALLIINTLGILEILYIYVFSKMKPRKLSKKEEKPIKVKKKK
jgi:hypothetical protein